MRDSTDAVVGEDGSLTVQVANKKIARLVQLGVHTERENRLREARRRQQRQSRRTNRRSK